MLNGLIFEHVVKFVNEGSLNDLGLLCSSRCPDCGSQIAICGRRAI